MMTFRSSSTRKPLPPCLASRRRLRMSSCTKKIFPSFMSAAGSSCRRKNSLSGCSRTRRERAVETKKFCFPRSHQKLFPHAERNLLPRSVNRRDRSLCLPHVLRRPQVVSVPPKLHYNRECSRHDAENGLQVCADA